MPRARWWVVGALAVVTLLVVVLDATEVIFTEGEDPGAAAAAPIALPPTPDAALALAAPVEPAPAPPDQRLVRAVNQALSVDALGPSVHGVVSPLADPTNPWLEIDADDPATPASTIKLWTAAAVLDALPVEQRLVTEALWDPASGTVILVGGGDATLETDPERSTNAASLTELAKVTAKRVIRANDGPISVRLRYDSTYFTGPTTSPGWESTYVSSGVIGPVTALMVDQGRIDPGSDARWLEPDAAAAFRFGQLLEEAGLTVKERAKPVNAANAFNEADVVGQVGSAPVGDLVERMLRDSDNQLAESLGRVAAHGVGRPPSFSGAAEAIRLAAESRGVDLAGSAIYDASGLSRDDTLPSRSLVEALHAASSEPRLASILSGLAVAGFDGTLTERFAVGPAADGAGVVRAKTGTLTGISAETGVVTTCDGDLVAFAFLADEVADTESAREALDETVAALATCPKRL